MPERDVEAPGLAVVPRTKTPFAAGSRLGRTGGAHRVLPGRRPWRAQQECAQRRGLVRHVPALVPSRGSKIGVHSQIVPGLQLSVALWRRGVEQHRAESTGSSHLTRLGLGDAAVLASTLVPACEVHHNFLGCEAARHLAASTWVKWI